MNVTDYAANTETTLTWSWNLIFGVILCLVSIVQAFAVDCRQSNHRIKGLV